MQVNRPVEDIIQQIHALDRKQTVAELLEIHTPRLDFTEEYLEGLNLDQLRHLLMAACIQARRSAGHRRAS